MTLTKIRKRDGRLAEFNEEKIARACAIEKAFNATYKPGRGGGQKALADEVLSILEVEGRPSRCGAHSGSGGAGAHGQRLCADRQSSSTGRSAAAPGDEHPPMNL